MPPTHKDAISESERFRTALGRLLRVKPGDIDTHAPIRKRKHRASPKRKGKGTK